MNTNFFEKSTMIFLISSISLSLFYFIFAINFNVCYGIFLFLFAIWILGFIWWSSIFLNEMLNDEN